MTVRRRSDCTFGLALVDWAVAAMSFVTSCRALGNGNGVRAVLNAALGGMLAGMGLMLFSRWLAMNRE